MLVVHAPDDASAGDGSLRDVPRDPLDPLARAAARGDDDAACALIVALGPAMLRATRAILGRAHPELEDVLQDATIATLGALASFRGECSVQHFACRIATMTSLAARRRLRVRARVRGDEPREEAAAAPAGDERLPIHDAVAARSRDALRTLLDELPDAQAETLVLHCVLGYTNDEIARAMGVPLNTVRSRLRLSKEALRERIAGDTLLLETLRGES
jgi:RNA polymerase sigma-70 factor (ECF subfamily)